MIGLRFLPSSSANSEILGITSFTRPDTSGVIASRIKAPTVSLPSSKATWRRCILPWKVSAWVAACPPKVSDNLAVTCSMLIVFSSAAESPIPSFTRAPVLPSAAFAIALVTASSDLPEPAETSRAMACSRWASLTSLVAVTRRCKDGRSSSSVTPVARVVLVI